MFKIFFFFIVAKTVAANNTLTIVTMAGSQGVPGAWIGCIALRWNGRWNGIPWGHLSACWASAGWSPWHDAIPSAVLSGGDVQRRRAKPIGCLLALALNALRIDTIYALPKPWMTHSISCTVKSAERPESHPGALSSSWTLANVLDLV